MICPKCFTLETEGSLSCRKCGAQLYTGVFRRPVEESEKDAASGGPARTASRKANLLALAVFALSVLILVLILSQLQAPGP